MSIHLGSPTTTLAAAAAADSSTPTPIPEEEEFYSSWSLFLVCLLLILSLWTSYYLQIKRIRAIHETVVSIVAGMVVGFIVRIAPGHLIREMLVSRLFFDSRMMGSLYGRFLRAFLVLENRNDVGTRTGRKRGEDM
jgi:sodium/hydrogen exchanger-like protein 6/7